MRIMCLVPFPNDTKHIQFCHIRETFLGTGRMHKQYIQPGVGASCNTGCCVDRYSKSLVCLHRGMYAWSPASTVR